MKIEEFERLKAESVGHLLIKAARIYNEYAFEQVKAKMKYEKLKPSHLQLFAHIPFEGITIVELAKKLEISKQAVSKLVADLVDEGLLIKKENPNDSRSFLVTFELGERSMLFKGMRELSNLDSELESLLGVKNTKSLQKMLTKIIEAF